MDKKAVGMMAFVACNGLYKYTRILSGSKIAPAAFQRAMDGVPATVKYQYALVYIDEVIMSSETSKKHSQNIEKVLMLLKHAGIRTKLKDNSIFDETIDYSGHIVVPGRIHVGAETTKTVKALQLQHQ